MKFFNQIKTWVLLLVMMISIGLMIFFIFQNSAKSKQQKITDNFEIKIIPEDEKINNLKPEIIFDAIDQIALSQSLLVKPKLIFNQHHELIVVYYAKYNPEKFEYYFLQHFIRVLPQWNQNQFQFSYNSSLQYAWVKYGNDEKSNYLNWFFKIINLS